MLVIRLSRFGRKNAPTFRLTVSEKSKDARGDVLEYLGSYNPRANPKFIQLNEERIKYWLSQGAQASATVHNLLISQGILEGSKSRAFRIKKKKEKAGEPEEKIKDKSVKEEKKIEKEKKEEVPVEEEKEEAKLVETPAEKKSEKKSVVEKK